MKIVIETTLEALTRVLTATPNAEVASQILSLSLPELNLTHVIPDNREDCQGQMFILRDVDIWRQEVNYVERRRIYTSADNKQSSHRCNFPKDAELVVSFGEEVTNAMSIKKWISLS